MATISQLQTRAQEIAEATKTAENTAARVGGLFKEIVNLLQTAALSADVYTKQQIDSLLTTIKNQKADASTVYTKQQIESLLDAIRNAKANIADVYTKQNVEELIEACHQEAENYTDSMYEESLKKISAATAVPFINVTTLTDDWMGMGNERTFYSTILKKIQARGTRWTLCTDSVGQQPCGWLNITTFANGSNYTIFVEAVTNHDLKTMTENEVGIMPTNGTPFKRWTRYYHSFNDTSKGISKGWTTWQKNETYGFIGSGGISPNS